MHDFFIVFYVLFFQGLTPPSSPPAKPSPFCVPEPQPAPASMAAGPVVVARRDATTETQDSSTATEPECLGPCEPGTSVTLEGIVWQETENGEYWVMVYSMYKLSVHVDSCE